MSHIQLREYYFDDFGVDAIVRVLNIQLMHAYETLDSKGVLEDRSPLQIQQETQH